MRDSFTLLYVHIVWATWDRLPLLTDAVKDLAYACIQRECREQKATVIALGGVEDHVHLLLRIPATEGIAALVKRVKGVSSRIIGQAIPSETPFKWQGSYGAFSVSPWDVSKIRGYIACQQEHHRNRTTKPALEHIGEPGAVPTHI